MNRTYIICVLFFLLSYEYGSAIESGVNIYGFSYHPDRKDSRGHKFQEWNPGLGYHVTLKDTKHATFFADAGLFLNSSSKSTIFSAAGAEWKFPAGLSVGIFGALVYSSTYNSGKPLVAPLPSVSFRHRQWRLNCTYIPKYKDVNRNSSFGFSLTWFL